MAFFRFIRAIDVIRMEGFRPYVVNMDHVTSFSVFKDSRSYDLHMIAGGNIALDPIYLADGTVDWTEVEVRLEELNLALLHGKSRLLAPLWAPGV